MIIEYSEVDDSRVRWNSGGEWKSADIDELIAAYERKRGKWKHDADGLVWCYECGFGKERSDERPYNYCPNCGAKMERSEE